MYNIYPNRFFQLPPRALVWFAVGKKTMILWSRGRCCCSALMSACMWCSCSTRSHICGWDIVSYGQTEKMQSVVHFYSTAHEKRGQQLSTTVGERNTTNDQGETHNVALVHPGVGVRVLLLNRVDRGVSALQRHTQHLLQRRRHRGAEAQRLPVARQRGDDLLDCGAEALVQKLVALVLLFINDGRKRTCPWIGEGYGFGQKSGTRTGEPHTAQGSAARWPPGRSRQRARLGPRPRLQAALRSVIE